MIDQPKRNSPWFLLTGLLIGIGLGLMVAWYWYPVERVDTHPVTMRSDFKDNYRVVIAAAFEVNGDLGRAKARLDLLHDENPQEALSSQAQVMMASGASQKDARALGLLAAALAESGGGEVNGSSGSESSPETTPTAISTPLATQTPIPTITPTATTGAPFTVELFNEVCDPNQPDPMIMVYVFDAARQPVPGVEVIVRWDGGEDRFYTGLKIEISPGYADFMMGPEVIYNVSLALSDQPVSGLSTRECDVIDGTAVYSSWEITFVQP